MSGDNSSHQFRPNSIATTNMTEHADGMEGVISPWIPVIAAAGVGAMGVGAAMYYNSGQALVPPISLDQQSVEISKEGRERVHPMNADGGLKHLLFDDVTTCYEGFRRGLRVSENGPCLGQRVKRSDDSWSTYQWMSYGEALTKAEQVGEGLLDLGFAPGQNTHIAIYSVNRPEWVIMEQACYMYNMVTVPLYDTLGPDACIYVINKSEIGAVMCDDVKKADSLLSRHSSCPSIRLLVVTCDAASIPEEIKAKAEAAGVELLSFDEVAINGKTISTKTPQTPPSPSDLATICYTSGTTGTPKGVLMSHANIIAATATLHGFKYSVPTPQDVMMSYLPLAHMFERMMHAALYQTGASVGFFRGDTRLLTDDIQELRPTFLPVVPRLLNRIYDKTVGEVSKSAVKKFIFDWALKSKSGELNRQIVRCNSLWDKLVFKKIREALGGRVRLMVTGSAPCADNVLSFIRAASGCIVLEGYGQTETGAICTVSTEGDASTGNVGPPCACSRLKLVDVPDMNYYAKDSVGEVCVKGPNVFSGYYKDPEKTSEAFDSDGWMHTGDIGRWLPDGKLKLVDRKKHIFKLAQGEYIAPEKIENIYMNSKFVAQAFVYGESLKASLVAIVVPDGEILLPYAKKEGIPGSLVELCHSDTVKKLIMDDMVKEGKKAGLASFEQVRDVHLYDELFSVENGLLTPTFKSKRPAIQEYFKEQLATMYKVLQ